MRLPLEIVATVFEEPAEDRHQEAPLDRDDDRSANGAAVRLVAHGRLQAPGRRVAEQRLAVAADGSVYYSDYARGFLGRLDLATDKVAEWPSPGGPGSRPYGIAIAPDGTVWYSESGVTPNTLVRFDPGTKQFSTAPIPSGGGVVRNMVATPDGKLYLACSGVNKVAVAEITR